MSLWQKKVRSRPPNFNYHGRWKVKVRDVLVSMILVFNGQWTALGSVWLSFSIFLPQTLWLVYILPIITVLQPGTVRYTYTKHQSQTLSTSQTRLFLWRCIALTSGEGVKMIETSVASVMQPVKQVKWKIRRKGQCAVVHRLKNGKAKHKKDY